MYGMKTIISSYNFDKQEDFVGDRGTRAPSVVTRLAPHWTSESLELHWSTSNAVKK